MVELIVKVKDNKPVINFAGFFSVYLT